MLNSLFDSLINIIIKHGIIDLILVGNVRVLYGKLTVRVLLS
jgi:hypothetical protein